MTLKQLTECVSPQDDSGQSVLYEIVTTGRKISKGNIQSQTQTNEQNSIKCLCF